MLHTNNKLEVQMTLGEFQQATKHMDSTLELTTYMYCGLGSEFKLHCSIVYIQPIQEYLDNDNCLEIEVIPRSVHTVL